MKVLNVKEIPAIKYRTTTNSVATHTKELIELTIMGYTLDEIGKMFHVSRERIRQVLNRAGFTARNGAKKRAFVPPPILICPICEGTYYLPKQLMRLAHIDTKALMTEQGHLNRYAHCVAAKHPHFYAQSDWKLSLDVVTDYELGMKASDIAKKYNLPHIETTYRYLAQWDISARHEKGFGKPIGRDKKKKLEVVKYSQKKGLMAAAMRYGVSYERIKQLRSWYENTQQRI